MIPRQNRGFGPSRHFRPNDETSRAMTSIRENISGKKNSELYLLSLGSPSSPGIDRTESSSPGMLGRLLAIPSTTRTKASASARRPIQSPFASIGASDTPATEGGVPSLPCGPVELPRESDT